MAIDRLPSPALRQELLHAVQTYDVQAFARILALLDTLGYEASFVQYGNDISVYFCGATST